MDELGDRMKMYEQAEAGRRAMPLLPLCVRLDGRGFSRWTRDLDRPYDVRLQRLMVATTEALVQETGALVGYTQSDEISLVLYSDSVKSELWFGGKFQKLTSVAAAYASAFFNSRVPHFFNFVERQRALATFDCRAWNVPSLEEAANTLAWRELDATKNSVSMAARHYYSHKQLLGLGRAEMLDLMVAKGVNWNDYPAAFKRGTYVRRRTEVRGFTTEEVESLPPRHRARKDPGLVVERTVLSTDELPPVTRITNRVRALFFGETPLVSVPEPT